LDCPDNYDPANPRTDVSGREVGWIPVTMQINDDTLEPSGAWICQIMTGTVHDKVLLSFSGTAGRIYALEGQI
jgi:hypothetical protein